MNDREIAERMTTDLLARQAIDIARMRGALKHIGKELAEYQVEERRPTKDELFALLSWALGGLGEEWLNLPAKDH